MADVDFVPFTSRPEWADVEPIYHDDAETAVVNITYSEQFRETFAYLRAVLASEEQSERAFQLTTEAVILNPANYTAWQYRRHLIKTLRKNLAEELKFCGEQIIENPKNYQVWHHRKEIIQCLQDASEELQFIATILKDDAKNYHAWQHRHWVVREFNLWDQELQYSVKLLEEDLRNNSAWNYRYYVIQNTTGFSPEILDQEIRFTFALIKKVPNNESSWNYLSGILIENGLSSRPDVWQMCETLYKDTKPHSPYLMAFMVEYLNDCLDEQKDPFGLGKEHLLKKIEELCQELPEVDPVRRNFWKYLKDSINAKHSQTPK